MFHQPVPWTFADGYVMLLRKTGLHFTGAKAFIRFCINFQNLLLKQLIFPLFVRRLTVNVLVVSTPIHAKNPVKDGDAMLFGKSLDCF